MVHLQMNGYIADNLFQYAAARLVAERLGFGLEISHSNLHPETNVPQLEALLEACADAPLSLPGQCHSGPLDYSAHLGRQGFDGYDLDLDALVARRDPRRIEMRGYYQRYALFRPHKARLRSWFAMRPDDQGYAVTPDDLVVHVRRGDLLVFGLAMSLRYYSDLLARLPLQRLFVVGCGLDTEVRSLFAPYDPVYVEGEPVEDFRFMLAFDRLVLSNSGFAWWAGFLSGAREIHAPRMGHNTLTDHAKARQVDLEVDDEPRYLYVDDVPYQERDYTFTDLLRSRGQLRKQRLATATLSLLARRLGLGRNLY
jgi:hypothetical protein